MALPVRRQVFGSALSRFQCALELDQEKRPRSFFSKFPRRNGRICGRGIATLQFAEEIAALHLGAEYRRLGFPLQYFLESPVPLGLPDSRRSGR